MPSYLHPGVYIEEIPSGSKPIEAAGTSTACFIGYAARGPVNNETVIDSGGFEPMLITRYDEYDNHFGGIRDTADVEDPQDLDQMGHSVAAFFRNGGVKAYVIRIAVDSVASTGSLSGHIDFGAANGGAWGDALVARFRGKTGVAQTDPDADKEFTLEIGTGTGRGFAALEVFTNVSLDANDPGYIVDKINDGSQLVRVEVSDAAAARVVLDELFEGGSPPTTTQYIEVALSGGDDGDAGGTDDYGAVLSALLKYRDVNIICLPGLYYDRSASVVDQSASDVIDLAIAHCETMKNRMVIVDPPPGVEFTTEKQITDRGFPTSTYTALYYPWARVSNPFYDADTRPGVPSRLLIQPSGFAAGMWAKIDARRGVWKAPAGVETRLLGTAGFQYSIEDAEQDVLNPAGVNALRTIPSFGQVIWGTRTLATRADPEWRYVPVRRTAMFIEESIYNGIQWAVFEPNNHRLWGSLRGNIGSFMNGLFRAGAFQGEKASDAYFVRCGLGDTMTQGDIDRGQVIVIVGFAPLKPAEFVIVRIQQKVSSE
ncbi:MAG: phage tail sheath family protein [Gammaproteobacteria bacterium]|nr:phage tail sheath family protein [Gammaproteobacteria bacterium]